MQKQFPFNGWRLESPAEVPSLTRRETGCHVLFVLAPATYFFSHFMGEITFEVSQKGSIQVGGILLREFSSRNVLVLRQTETVPYWENTVQIQEIVWSLTGSRVIGCNWFSNWLKPPVLFNKSITPIMNAIMTVICLSMYGSTPLNYLKKEEEKKEKIVYQT